MTHEEFIEKGLDYYDDPSNVIEYITGLEAEIHRLFYDLTSWYMNLMFAVGDRCVFNKVEYICMANNICKCPPDNIYDMVAMSGCWEVVL